MPTKYDTRLKDRLLSDERHAALQPEELLRSFGLRKGQTMADIGCGPGFFTIPAARIVGEEGLVLAADIQGEMLTAVRSRVAEQGLANVRVVKTSDTEIPIPAESCDLVLMAFVLDEIEQRARFLHRAARLLRPRGKIAVVEWQKREQSEGPSEAERIAPDDLLSGAQAAGLRQDERRDIGEDYYAAIFSPSSR